MTFNYKSDDRYLVLAQLCLKWNYFQENVSKSFSVLRNCTDFQDVTLVREGFKGSLSGKIPPFFFFFLNPSLSDDHQKFLAHRIILSTCSEYFRAVLRGNAEHKPILCLDNVSFKDLESILDYIYHGETQVEQKQVVLLQSQAQKN